MSFQEGNNGQELHRGKKRRIEHACDMCRRKKSDGTQMRGDKCTTCLDGNLDCTYSEAPVNRRPPTKNYVDSLESRLEQSEARLEHSEALVRQLRAELANAHLKISSNTSLPNSSTDTGKKTAEATVRAEGINGTDASMFIVRAELRDLAAPPPHADDLMHLELTRKFEKLKVGSTLEQPFMGKSSGAVLLKVAIDLKDTVTWKERQMPLGRHSREQSREDVSVEGRQVVIWGTPRTAPHAYVQVPIRGSHEPVH
ncbi:hypothetical protein B0H19DRAFT_1077978 [Mycena capillaripes]|nr:hypothetical protein B0H19DRAFT_1077978 [Mycena capillaripes]